MDDDALDWDLEGLVVAGRFPLMADDKLGEGRFLLDLMQRTTDRDQFRWLTSACLGAARAAIDWMAYELHHITYWDQEGNDCLDEEYVQAATRVISKYFSTDRRPNGSVFARPIHPLLKELSRHRKETAHYGPLWIKPESVSSASDYIFKDGGKPVIQFCADVFDLLVGISGEVQEKAGEFSE